ncbi:MAG: hypothetical protein KGJ06_08910, partial [Pseudomonadota bacterium]|nr:hypothetical protein [Pseudomonadota bacterium]
EPSLKQLFKYYQLAIEDQTSWFIHLYKIKDLLVTAHENERTTLTALNISRADWKDFGMKLNDNSYDTRHANMDGKVTSISSEEKGHLLQQGYHWINAYLQSRGLLEYETDLLLSSV